MKICSKCHIEKDFSEFHHITKNKDGLHVWCKECVKIWGHNKYINNPDYYRIAVKNWQEKNSTQLREYQQTWRKENYDWMRRWWKENPDKPMQYYRAYYKKNYTHILISHQNRRALGEIDIKAFEQKFIDLGSQCFYCHCPLVLEKNLPNSRTIDHMLPIKRGGTNDIDNLAPACWDCNRKKHTRTAEEFLNKKDVQC